MTVNASGAHAGDQPLEPIAITSLSGSMIGGIPETQEMLDFCAEHGIVADIEMIRVDEINAAYERMLEGDVKYRFVIDSSTLAA